jgi:hypothetical protein
VLGADTRSADAARILRVPGTRNLKHDPPRAVTVSWFKPARRFVVSELVGTEARHALLGAGNGRIAFRNDRRGRCRSETTPLSMSLDSLPSEWSTGNEFGDCPVSAYGTGR